MTVSPEPVLNEVFRLPAFRPGQRAVIDALLAGRSALAVFPTGGGKSLCYQLPALLLPGLSLVVSPLIALMKDQVDRLQELGIAAARLDSSLGREAVQSIYQAMAAGRLTLLYVSPERLNNERFLQRLARCRIALLAVDEAHCISEWGHNFRPDYLKLADLAREVRAERVLALTATATPAVREDICRRFGIAPGDAVHTGVRRPNLSLSVTPCPPQRRRALLLERLRAAPGEASIVYVTLQQTAEDVAAFLREHGLSAACYHAGLDGEARERVQNAFMAGALDCVVATIAFGMGIDKADIRALYHYNLPKSLENYMQEIGRAGRDGLPSRCEILAAADDLRVLANFSYGDTPCEESLTELLDAIRAQPESFALSSYEWSQRFDIRPLVLGTALTYLELAGAIRATGAFYTEYKLAFRTPAEAICAAMDARRAEFLRALFASGKSGRSWLTLDPASSSAALGEPLERIQKALDYLEEQGLVELQASGLRQGYRRLVELDVDALRAERGALFAKREQADIRRLQQVLDFAAGGECLPAALQAYFGEAPEPGCGQCSSCVEGGPRAIPGAGAQSLTDGERALIAQALAASPPGLRRPRQLARFLCGLPSPATSRGKLKQDPRFGSLGQAAFPLVLQELRALAGAE